MQSPADQKAIVQRMIDAGESEQAIASVIQHFKTVAQPTTQAQTPPAAPSRSLLSSTGYGAGVDTLKGILQSVATPIQAGGEMLRLNFPSLDKLPSANLPIDMQTDTPGEKVGYAAGTLGSLILPQAAASRGITAASKLLPKGAQLAARAAGEGVVAGGISGATGGDAGTAATLGAAIPVVGTLAGAVNAKLTPALRQAAEKKVAQALGATKEKFKAIAAKRAPQILDRGLSGSKEAMLKDATAQAKEIGAAIDDVFKQHGSTAMPTSAITAALEDAKASYQTFRTVPLGEAIKEGLEKTPGAKIVGNMVEVPVVLDPRPVAHLTELQNIVKGLGDEATVDQLRALRKVWDDVVDQAGGFQHKSPGSSFGIPLSEQTEAWAKKQGANAIREMLNSDVPDLGALNKEFSFWSDLRKVIKSTQGRQQAQSNSLNRVISSGVGSTIGGMSGDSYTERAQNAIAGAIVGPQVFKAMTSTRWRMVDAGLRDRLAKALASGVPGEISAALAKVAVITGTSASPSTPEQKAQHR